MGGANIELAEPNTILLQFIFNKEHHYSEKMVKEKKHTEPTIKSNIQIYCFQKIIYGAWLFLTLNWLRI
jgi:hypothetical protein